MSFGVVECRPSRGGGAHHPTPDHAPWRQLAGDQRRSAVTDRLVYTSRSLRPVGIVTQGDAFVLTLPPLQTGKSAWVGSDLAATTERWIVPLARDDIHELESAAHEFIASGRALADLSPDQFPLPTLAPKLSRLREQLIHGVGFFVLRGLPVAEYNEVEASTIFFGLGSHIGRPRSQNARGHLLGHVVSTGASSKDPGVRIYQTSERQTFHTDSCDVVGLLCLRPARTGGLSLLVSAATVFNEMSKRRPDLLRLLFEPIATDRRDEVPAGMLPYLLIPVFSYFEQQITPFYQRQYIESAQRFEDAPRLTDRHIDALDLFDALCNAPGMYLSAMLEVGDIQFVYNHALLHDRTGFTDWPQPERRRHLMRLWLSVPGDRPLPEVFASRFGSVEIGNRGGIVVPGSRMCVPRLREILSANCR